MNDACATNASSPEQNQSMVRDETDVSWTAVLTRLGIALGVALGFYAAIVRWLIDPYILNGSSAGRVAGVYDGYGFIQQHRSQHGDTNSLVLFWGSSMIREGIDCAQLETASPAVTAYNLAVSGDIPCRRLVELPRAKALNPQRVIIGVSYPEIFEDRLPFDDQISVLPASAYASLPSAALELMDERFKAKANRSEWEKFFWKRKFFTSAAFTKLGLSGRGDRVKTGHATEFKAPWVYDQGIEIGEMKRFLARHQNSYPPYTGNQHTHPGQSLAARSLVVLVKELEAQGANVLLVNMPLHPLLNAVVPAQRREALRSFLQRLGSDKITFVDCQDRLSADHFVDLLHLNAQGRTAFTETVSHLLDSSGSANFTQANRAF